MPILRFELQFDKLRKFKNTAFKCLPEDESFCERILVEALYESALKQEAAEIEEVRKQEALKIPNNLDYNNETLNLSNEERIKLALARPQTVSNNFPFCTKF